MHARLSALFALLREVVMPTATLRVSCRRRRHRPQVPHAYLHLTDSERCLLPRRARTCRGLLEGGTRGMSAFRGLRDAAEVLHYH